MPLTFLAHQAPFVPLLARHRDRIDGLAFVIGTMAPDLPYVAARSRWTVWAHEGWAVLWCNVPIALAVSWITARLLAPVVADHLPGLGPFHLRDYRGLAAHRFTVWSPVWALVGAFTHIGMDHFTHDWGWVASNWGWYSRPFGEFLGRVWSPYRVLQYTGHVGGSLACLVLLAHYGRHRWFADRASRVPPYPVSRRSLAVTWGCVLVGVGTALAWVLSDRSGAAADIMRVAGGAYAGLLAAALWLGGLDGAHRGTR